MREAGFAKTAVWRWQERFMQEGVDGLLRDKKRPSRIPPLAPEIAGRFVALTIEPPPGETLSIDPNFAAKLRDVVGLYIYPPAHAVLLSVDEKSQIQALDRTQPWLPLKRGRCGTTTHDYKRNGTTTLFAALNVAAGRVIGRCMQRHRHRSFIRFLSAIEREVPVGKLMYVILDNYAAHVHPKVIEWLGRHPRFSFHFTPISASWLNAVEDFVAKLTKQRLKLGMFHSLVSLQAAVNRYLAQANDDLRPFL